MERLIYNTKKIKFCFGFFVQQILMDIKFNDYVY